MSLLPPRRREPMLNVPGVLVGTLVVLLLVHLVRISLSETADVEMLLLFSFIPARYDASVVPDATWPGGLAADIWTFVTYALLHADWMHLGFNAIWFLAFGTPVARRFGPVRFIAFCAVTAAAGALAHLISHFGQLVPMVGASGTISGMMAAATRFAFHLSFGGRGADAHRTPALPLTVALKDTRILAFIIVWFVLNLLFGLGSIPLGGGEQQSVAWQAHVGGFLAGLLLFGLFDPARAPTYRNKPPHAA